MSDKVLILPAVRFSDFLHLVSLTIFSDEAQFSKTKMSRPKIWQNGPKIAQIRGFRAFFDLESLDLSDFVYHNDKTAMIPSRNWWLTPALFPNR